MTLVTMLMTVAMRLLMTDVGMMMTAIAMMLTTMLRMMTTRMVVTMLLLTTRSFYKTVYPMRTVSWQLRGAKMPSRDPPTVTTERLEM